jgi:uncharacterized damage-inducible protein DinB
MAMSTEVAFPLLAALLTDRWEQVSRKLEALGQELPEEALERPPMPGVRPYGAVLRHIAFWNQYVADTLCGNKADDASNEFPLAEYSTKPSILTALKRSSDAVTSALRDRRSLDPKSAELLITFIEHTSEHYGQLVVYSRLMGVVPVTSRV